MGDAMKTDIDGYNENRNPGKFIQIVFDFTLDLVEGEAASNS